MHAKRLNVLVFAPGQIPSVTIGILRPLVELERRGEIALRLRLASWRIYASADIDWCDIAVFSRNCEPKDLDYLYQLKRRGKRIIYEIDDNFEEIPLNTTIGLYHRAFYRLHALRRFFAQADLTRVYSERMKQRAEAHGARVRLIRSYFDFALIQGQTRAPEGKKVRICYPTGRVDDPRFEKMFFESLRRIITIHKGNVELHFWGKSAPKLLTGMEGVILHNGISSYEEFIRSFYAKGFDIGLAPLIDEPFFHSKSNNKYRELGGCGIAGIYSNVQPYASCVVDGVSGLLVANTVEAWVAAIDRMIDDRKLRRDIANAAREDVTQNYTFENAVETFRKCLLEVASKNPAPCDWIFPKDLGLYATFVGSNIDEASEEIAHLPNRWLSFINAVTALHADNFQQIDPISVLDHPIAIKESNVVLYALNDTVSFCQAAASFSLCSSIILDLSRFESTAETSLSDLVRLTHPVPVTLLLAKNQYAFIAEAKSMNWSIALVDPATTYLTENYSLDGYAASYIDLIERHWRYGRSKKKFRLQKATNRLRRHIAARWHVYSGRARRVWLLVRWRLGQRPL